MFTVIVTSLEQFTVVIGLFKFKFSNSTQFCFYNVYFNRTQSVTP